jgi:hypothetical protein
METKSRAKCQCGHTIGEHDKDGVCWGRPVREHTLYCLCNKFKQKERPERKPAKVKRWSYDSERNVLMYDRKSLWVGDMADFAKALNRARVVLPGKVQR